MHTYLRSVIFVLILRIISTSLRFDCNNTLNAGVFDGCGVCNGDNSTCIIREGNFTDDVPPWEQREWTEIPVGAYNIEMSFVWNDMKQYFTEIYNKEGHPIITSHFPESRIFQTGNSPVSFAGTLWHNDAFVAIMHAKGPLTEPVIVKVYSFGYNRNTGMKYIYSVPTDNQINDEKTKKVTEVTNQKGTTKVPDETNVKETVSVIDETDHKENGTVTELIPQYWMRYFNTIDSELPRAFKWINDDGDNFVLMKNNYHNLVKDSLKNKAVSTDNGIYQLVRTLEDGKEDSINVVLHVTDHLPCTLLVDPNFWNDGGFQGKVPMELKKMIASKTDIKKIPEEYEVEWKFRSKLFTKFESFGKNRNSTKGRTVVKKNGTASLKLTSTLIKRYRQYRCTVTFKSGLKQIYFFIVKVLGENPSKKEKGHNIVGVPNILKEKGEFFYYFAYGSNLLKERLLVKNKDAEFVANAELKGYTLDFISLKEPTNSTWKGGVANIIPSKNDSVRGVIWKLNVENIPSLDGQESTYEAINVKLIVETNREICRTYLIDPTKASKEWNHTPSPQYLHIIVLGAQRQMLPPEYIKKLKKIPHNENIKEIEVYDELIKKMNIENITQHPFESSENYFNRDEKARKEEETEEL